MVAVRVRRLLARTAVRRVLVAVIAAATGLIVMATVQAAERAGERWGATRSVAVALRDLDVGETVDQMAVELRNLPAAAVSAAALTELPVGAVVRQPVAAGEPLVEERIAPHGLTGVAALVPAGTRAVAVPVGPAGIPPVAVGDQVDVLALLAAPEDVHGHGHDHDPQTMGPAAHTLVERAAVVDVREEAVSVAVPAIEVPALVAALGQGAVLLTLAGA
jgi:Flp pilus assembly protein CpaB